jgi:hypothetical protein
VSLGYHGPHHASTCSGDMSAEGAGLEPDPMVGSDMAVVNHLGTPVPFTLLPATLAAKIGELGECYWTGTEK